MHTGYVLHDELIGQPDGSLVLSSGGSQLLAMRPTLADHVLALPRQAQPIYAKDAALIITLADIGCGSRVLEAGTGAGALTLHLLRATGPDGSLYSYEVRPEFAEQARSNVATILGEAKHGQLRGADASEGFVERDLDAVLLDLPEPGAALEHAVVALRPGGTLSVFCPNLSQVDRLRRQMRETPGLGLSQTLEVLVRPWVISARSTRPNHRMVAHTGFLTFTRRLGGAFHFEAERERW